MTNSDFSPSLRNPVLATLHFDLSSAGPTLGDLKTFVATADAMGVEDSEMLVPFILDGERVGLELHFEVE